nr:alpha/beta fold hydrolase [Kibdelosporangium sp. MJ126-NF4]CEL13676.1 Lysophospholipase; Monoglyceride lipase; putative [Kibdelosporangium sp. MJ126-NF4]CTQ99362.1 Lysophospholipase (EC 3.1.1.5); Monoglyceride lipase (EC 3.1.1.23); putative [Kibdelosporangium sp. MJ126-NF4]
MPEFAGSTGTIHYRHWVPDDPRVLLVHYHGLGEHTGLYEAFAAALNAAGIAVWAHDQLGHGRSDGVRVLIDNVDHLLDDAETLLGLAKDAHPDLPVVISGHSLGSAVATLLTAERLLPTHRSPAALILAGSSLVHVPGADSALVELLASGADPMDLRKDPGEMSRNEAYARQIREDPLTWQGGIRLETLQALGVGAARLSAVIESRVLDVPVLVVHGEKDDMAPAAGARETARLLPNARAAIFPDDLHNILNEIDREDVWKALVDFVKEVTGD